MFEHSRKLKSKIRASFTNAGKLIGKVSNFLSKSIEKFLSFEKKKKKIENKSHMEQGTRKYVRRRNYMAFRKLLKFIHSYLWVNVINMVKMSQLQQEL